MTKHAALARYVALALFGACVAAVLDFSLVRLDLGWAAWIVDVAFASALIIVTIGCFAPNAPFFGRVIDGNGVHEDVVAVTFDDGPSPDTTPRVLDALRAAGVRATFFVLGKHAESHPELVDRIVRDGHELGSHGYSHGILVFAPRRRITWELVRTHSLLQAAGGPPVRLFRAPHGFRNPFVVGVARRLGYRVVGWTKGVFDTALPGADVIAERAGKALEPGAILLLHDGDGSGVGNRSQTADALPAILQEIHDRKLRAVTISELAEFAPVRRTSFVRLALVVVGVALIVTVAFDRLDRHALRAAWDTARGLSLPLVVAALIANFVSVWFKATVWKAALDTIPGHPRFRYQQIVPAIFIGFLLNAALVARLGDIGRMFVLRRRLQKDSGATLATATIAGTVVVEQIILGLTLLGILIVMTFTVTNVPDGVRRGVLVLLAVVVAMVVAAVAVEMYARWARRRRRRRGPLRTGAQEAAPLRSWRSFAQSAEALAHGLSHGLDIFRDWRLATSSLGAGVLSWLAQLLGIWLTLRAFGIEHHALGASAAVFLASNLIGLVQVTPGNIGTFQFAVAFALSQTYGINQATGITFGIVLQLIEIALGAGLGLVFLTREGLSFGEVRRGIRAAERDAGEPEPPRLAPSRVERRRLVV